jgi:phospho-N-acetylmuramoyl-pentapeptide-transferase
MLYYFFEISEWAKMYGVEWSLLKKLDVFQDITFRAVGASITAFLLSLVFGNLVVRQLVSLGLGQPIRTQGETRKLFELHREKRGTPTMGGILPLGTTIISSLLWARLPNPFVWLAILSIVYLGFLGLVDDYLKVVRCSSSGISSRFKFGLQCLLAAAVVLFLFLNPQSNALFRQLYIPFSSGGSTILHLGWFAFCIYPLVIVGASNAVNLTDGLDGLAAGCTAVVAASYGILSYVAGDFKIASYLQVPFVLYSRELSVLCMALFGSCLGFLWWNCHPARVFMGDTGSLAMGGFLGITAICCKQELLLTIIGGTFVIEALSVILQVASFRLTGRRLIKMSPLHHHFELSGWKESTVIVRFWIMSVLFSLLGLATLRLR